MPEPGSSAFRQQILDVAKTQGEPKVEPNRLLDDLGREMVPAITDFSHLLECGAAWENTSLAARDNAVGVRRHVQAASDRRRGIDAGAVAGSPASSARSV